MKRRNFFRTAALGGGTFALAPLSSCVQPSVPTSAPEDYSAFELNEVTITQLQGKMSSGNLTSQEITQKYLDRIDRIDKMGPELRSVIEINPEAIDIAKKDG